MNPIARILMTLLGLIFSVGFLVALLLGLALYTVWASLRWLLTGRKPQVVLVWQQFSKLRQAQAWHTRRPPYTPDSHPPQGRYTHPTDNVVDVQAHEVKQDPPHLPKS